MNLQGQEGFQIGLDAGATAGITATDREGDRWNHGGSGAVVILNQLPPMLRRTQPGPAATIANGPGWGEPAALLCPCLHASRLAAAYRNGHRPSVPPGCDRPEQTSCRNADRPWREERAMGPMLANSGAVDGRCETAARSDRTTRCRAPAAPAVAVGWGVAPLPSTSASAASIAPTPVVWVAGG